jgi:hypothetical protein
MSPGKGTPVSTVGKPSRPRRGRGVVTPQPPKGTRAGVPRPCGQWRRPQGRRGSGQPVPSAGMPFAAH